MSDRTMHRCCECDQWIPDDEPRLAIDIGWAHPTCAQDWFDRRGES